LDPKGFHEMTPGLPRGTKRLVNRSPTTKVHAKGIESPSHFGQTNLDRFARRAISFASVLLTAACLAPADAPTTGAADSVGVNPNKVAVAIDDSIRLHLKIWHGAAYTQRTAGVTWLVSDSTVALIDSVGLLSGRRAGTAVVTAITDGTAAHAQVTVAPAILAGAGDIADCSSPGDQATAALLDGVGGIVFTAGDNAYPFGTADQFATCYGPSWGRHKSRTRPAPGNHEYMRPGAAGYFGYFGEAAGDPALGYYSYDLASWHIVVINSSVDIKPGSPQELWLRADLASHPTRCTLAYWHYPRFSSGLAGNYSVMQAMWQALYDAGADVVISAHDHDYERFAPQTPSGLPDSVRGIREFVVGTGGKSLVNFDRLRRNSEVRDNSTFGVLLLKLYDDRYEWEFMPTQVGGFTDAGADTCH